MKRLNVTVTCMAVYNSGIDVPDEMILEEAIEYAKEHNETELLIADLSFAEHLDELKMLVNNFESVLHIDHHSYPNHFFPRLYQQFVALMRKDSACIVYPFFQSS